MLEKVGVKPTERKSQHGVSSEASRKGYRACKGPGAGRSLGWENRAALGPGSRTGRWTVSEEHTQRGPMASVACQQAWVTVRAPVHVPP